MSDQLVALQRDVKAFLSSPSVLASISSALPRHMDGEKFARVALTAINKNPKLLECSRESLMLSMLQSAAIGLEPNGRDAHLIPYNSREGMQCQFQLDYKGIVQLVRRSGEIADIHCDVVRRGDLFEYRFGKVANHVPWFLRDDSKKPATSGEIYAVYSRVEMKDGGVACDVMSIEEVNAVRDNRSQGYRSAKKYNKSHPWDAEENGGSYCEMAKKTVFKRHSKWLPVSSELADALAKEDEQDDPMRVELDVGDAVQQARPKPPPKQKGAAAMAAEKQAEPVDPPKTVEPPEPTPAPVEEVHQDSQPATEAEVVSELPTATHELTAMRPVSATKDDGTKITIVACDLRNADDNKPLTAYWEGEADKLPAAGWVAVKLDLRAHSKKPNQKVAFIVDIQPAATPEI